MKRNISRKTIKKNIKKRKSFDNVYTDISQINDYLFIGNHKIAKDLERLDEFGITHIVNCADELEHYVDKYDKEKMSWIWLPMYDCSYIGNVERYIPDAIEFIDKAVNNKQKVLIHCAAGISRSSSITIAYLMYKHNLRYERAFSRVKAKRYCCQPNSKFVDQLKNYDFSLLR